jgi:hypothetical protein
MFRPYLGLELELARARSEQLGRGGTPRRPRRPPKRRGAWRAAVGLRMVHAGERLLHEAR